MKNRQLFLSILFLLTTNVFGQVYFPLNVGDIWDYIKHRMMDDCPMDYLCFEVLNDTNINGKRYANFCWDSFRSSSPFIRADSFRVFEYDTVDQKEYVLFDFTASDMDTISIHGTNIIIAFSPLSFMVIDTTVSDSYVYTIIDSVGIVNVGHDCVYDLHKAIVNGRQVYPTSVENLDLSIPKLPSLSQNYPNPFNPSTKITSSIPSECQVSLKVYDILGREVSTLIQGKKEPGEYSVTWNAEGLPNGVYFYRLVAGQYTKTNKMILMK